MNISRYPVLRGLVPYFFGILLGNHHAVSSLNTLIIIISSSFSVLVLLLVVNIFLPSFRNFSLISFFVLFLLLGFTMTNIKNYSTSNFPCQENVLFSGKQAARIVDYPEKKEKSVRIIANINNLSHPRIAPKAILYLKKDSASLSLSRGDLLLIDARLLPPAAPKNPDIFDYKAFLLRKGISLTAYLDSHSWVLLEHQKGFSPLEAARNLQLRFSDLFAKNGLSGPEYSVITAILLGNDDTMDPTLKSDYAAAGVSHILCVSGMHVGIIFMILNFLLKPMDYSRGLRFVKSLLLILAVWFYAAITGLAPSVQRSATMFTFVTVGGLLRRHVNIFHSLFASMFLLVLINPLLIFEMGFQMSYLAVFGIVIFQPRLSALLKPRTKIGNYFWELICVSIAAQLSTFPLSVYYFGQFPNYFLLSNLSVMSLSFIVIVTGVSLLALSWCPPVAGAVGWLLAREISLMNGIIFFIHSLPYSITENILFSLLQTMLIYGIIVLSFIYFSRKRKLLKYCALSFSVLLILSFSIQKYQQQNSCELTFYSVDKRTIIGISQGKRGVLLLDSAALTSTDWYDFNVKNHERHLGIQSQFVGLDTSFTDGLFSLRHNFLRFGDKTVFFLSKQIRLYPNSPPLPVDYLYVKDNSKMPLNKLLQTFEIKQVIVGSGVTRYYEKRWCDSCQTHQIPVYSLRENGYLTLKPDI